MVEISFSSGEKYHIFKVFSQTEQENAKILSTTNIILFTTVPVVTITIVVKIKTYRKYRYMRTYVHK